MRTPDPRRGEFRPEGHEQQNPEGVDLVDEPAEHFQARRIGPLRVLEDHQDRGLARNRLDPADQRFKRLLPALLRGEVQRGMAAVVRQRKHLGEKRGVLARDGGRCEQSVELVEPQFRAVLARKPGGPLHVADDRMERAIRVLRRAEIAQPHMRLARQPLQKRRGQARLADARLARKQNDLALARLRHGPAPLKEFALFFAPDQGRQPARVQRLEAALLRTLPQRRVGARRSRRRP